MTFRPAIMIVGFVVQTLAGCAASDFDIPPQRGIQSDIDASRTQRGDSLYPDSLTPHRRPGVESTY